MLTSLEKSSHQAPHGIVPFIVSADSAFDLVKVSIAGFILDKFYG